LPSAYYLPPPGETRLARLRERVVRRRKPVPAAPVHVQIQTVSGCNASCVFCPNQKTALEIPLGVRMDWDLYRSVVDQCVDLGVRRYSPYLMNEPMLDPELPLRIEVITRRKRRGMWSKINSHGGLFTERMARGLLDSGLDKLHFSVQGIDPAVYFRVMRLRFEKVLRNIERFLELKQKGGYRLPRVKIVMLDTTEIHGDLPRIRAFWRARGLEINLNQLENRGHHAKIQSDAIAVRPLQPFDWCQRMFDQLYVLHDGRLAQCCADWEQTSILGDLSRERLADVWRGAAYTEQRRRFLEGRVAGMLCDGCTKDAVGGDD
jgi:MoaA/NifB/PqqE/SkfB family radical SAM enzyme